MFAKAQWAVLGLNPASLVTFQTAFRLEQVPFLASQVVALARAKFGSVESVGINPFDKPRLDEGRDTGVAPDLEKLYSLLATETPEDLQTAVEWFQNYCAEYEKAFKLHAELPWYGLWFVINSQEDVSDLASIREDVAYEKFTRPYKFTGKEDKKVVESTAQGRAELLRTQFPVILDFNAGRVYIQNANQDNILVVRSLLQDLGAETYALQWKFGEGDFVTKFLNNKQGPFLYTTEIAKRAEEIRTFTGGELEEIQDPVVADVVETFFSVVDPGTGLQFGLSPSSTITLYPGGSPITVSNPSDFVNLLNGNSNAVINAARITFQEVDVRETRKGTKTYRNDLFTFDLNVNCMLWDAGAALIRGFDIPSFKHTVMNAIKRSKQEQPISYYWSEWLRLMNEGVHVFCDNVAVVLGISRSTEEFGLVAFGNSGVDTKTVQVLEPVAVTVTPVFDPQEQDLTDVI